MGPGNIIPNYEKISIACQICKYPTVIPWITMWLHGLNPREYISPTYYVPEVSQTVYITIFDVNDHMINFRGTEVNPCRLLKKHRGAILWKMLCVRGPANVIDHNSQSYNDSWAATYMMLLKFFRQMGQNVWWRISCMRDNSNTIAQHLYIFW